jgi:hypothetical protein
MLADMMQQVTSERAPTLAGRKCELTDDAARMCGWRFVDATIEIQPKRSDYCGRHEAARLGNSSDRREGRPYPYLSIHVSDGITADLFHSALQTFETQVNASRNQD